MKQETIIGVTVVSVFLILLMINLVNAEEIFSNAGVRYDTKISDKFNQNQAWVDVFFYLKNGSESESLLSNFSENEIQRIKIASISPEKIRAEITKEGFDKLINDSRVESVYFNVEVHALDDEAKVDTEVYTNLEIFEWVQVIIDVDSKDSIPNITSQISESDLKFKHEMMFRDAFVAEINEQGLETLINNIHVKNISWDRVAYTTNNGTRNESFNETKIQKEKGESGLGWVIFLLSLSILAIIIYTLFHNKKRNR